MTNDLKTHVKNRNAWLRVLFIIMLGVVYSIAEIVLVMVVLLQIITTLVTGRTNERALGFGKQLSSYVYQILLYLTYNTDQLPFPFSDWPKE